MVTLSLCMIVRDEEAVLARCLQSVRAAVDEMILVDTGSLDGTREIAGGFTEKIYDFTWIDDFSAARNYAVSKASGDYWMWLDADDVLSREAAEKLIRLKKQLDPKTDVIMMPYGMEFDSRNRPLFLYYRERILRNSPRYRFQGRVHECVPPAGEIRKEDILVEHRPLSRKRSDRNLKIYEKMKKEKAVFTSRDLYYYGRELTEHGAYEKGEKILRQFLERGAGWEEDCLEACRQRAFCLEQLGQEEKALEALLRGLAYGVPGGEICCALGQHFLNRRRYKEAIWWFRQALSSKKREDSGGFILEDCYGYLPAVSLCVCYDRIGDLKTAERYNELAGTYKPEDPSYLYNKAYFLQREKQIKRDSI